MQKKVILSIVSGFLFHISAFSHQIPDDIILKNKIGKRLVSLLKDADHELSTTGQRSEYKSVVDRKTVNQIKTSLGLGSPDGVQTAGGVILFQDRDSVEKPGFLNGTFTYYGGGAHFLNDGNIRTKFHLRVRLYLTVSPDLKEVERSSKMKDWAYLEIKIKNPTPEDKGGSSKFRMMVPDQDIVELFTIHPDSPKFDSLLGRIEKHALELKYNAVSRSPKNKGQIDSILENESRKISAMLTVIREISRTKSGQKFIKPILITNYIRHSYEFTETNYLSQNPLKIKKGFLSHFRNNEQASPSYSQVQYQLTIDDHIRHFIPKVLPTDQILDIRRYFAEAPAVTRYQPEEFAVELKAPKEIFELDRVYQSLIHQYITDHVQSLMEGQLVKGFKLNRGKYGNLSRFLKE